MPAQNPLTASRALDMATWRAFSIENLGSQQAIAYTGRRAGCPCRTRLDPSDPARKRIDALAGRFMEFVRR